MSDKKPQKAHPNFGARTDANIGVDFGVEPTGLGQVEHGAGHAREIETEDASKKKDGDGED